METDAEMGAFVLGFVIRRHGRRHTCPVFAGTSCQAAKSRKSKDLLAEEAVWVGPVSGPQFPANRDGVHPKSETRKIRDSSP